jgi:hypothetical protein
VSALFLSGHSQGVTQARGHEVGNDQSHESSGFSGRRPCPIEGIQKILALDTWESLNFNLDVGRITLCMVPQLFMLVTLAAWYLLVATCI